jgi:integrase
MMRKLTWIALRAEVLSLYEPPLRAIATYRQMRQAFDEFASLPSVKQVRDLSPPNVAAWLKAHQDRSAARNASMLRCLSAVASYAVKTDALKADPFDFRSAAQWVRLDSTPDRPKTWHRSAEAIGAVLAVLDQEAAEGSWTAGRLQALGYCYAFTGLRKDEALHLERQDIDLAERVLTIRPKADWRPKTVRSAARLPIAGPLAGVLDLWLPRCGCQWVFPGIRLSGPWTSGPPGKKPLDQIRAAGMRAGVPDLTILGFRKSLGTLAKVFGISQLELQALLRHSSVETQRYYDEADPAMLRGAVDRIAFPRLALTG